MQCHLGIPHISNLGVPASTQSSSELGSNLNFVCISHWRGCQSLQDIEFLLSSRTRFKCLDFCHQNSEHMVICSLSLKYICLQDYLWTSIQMLRPILMNVSIVPIKSLLARALVKMLLWTKVESFLLRGPGLVWALCVLECCATASHTVRKVMYFASCHLLFDSNS